VAAGSGKKDNMDKAGDLLKEVFAFYNISGGEEYVALFSSWRKLAGDDIAAHSRIFNLHKGALIVEVDHPGWAQMLRMRQTDILRRLSETYPALGIRMIHIKLIPDGKFSPPQTAESLSAGAEEEESLPPRENSVERDKRESDGLENIQDAGLRESLLRLKDSLGKKRARRKG
jgi:hypothetical protein